MRSQWMPAGRKWTCYAFCRTIFTTNFDTLLQTALQRVHLAYLLTDRPERFDREDFMGEKQRFTWCTPTAASFAEMRRARWRR